MANREWQHGRDDEQQRWGRDEQWRRDMGRDFERREWSPYDRQRDEEWRMREYRGMDDYYRGYPRDSGFGYGGMDSGFRGGGYGGYGARDERWRRDDQRSFFGPGSGMLERRGRAPRGYQRSDERIKEDICDRLMHSWVDAENVDVEVKQGEVTLSGTVENRQEKRMIEDICDDVLGVKDVQNRIRCSHRQEQQQQPQTSPTGQRKPTA